MMRLPDTAQYISSSKMGAVSTLKDMALVWPGDNPQESTFYATSLHLHHPNRSGMHTSWSRSRPSSWQMYCILPNIMSSWSGLNLNLAHLDAKGSIILHIWSIQEADYAGYNIGWENSVKPLHLGCLTQSEASGHLSKRSAQVMSRRDNRIKRDRNNSPANIIADEAEACDFRVGLHCSPQCILS
jgi:hypothetical protein